MRILPVLIGLTMLGLLATPVAADPKPGHGKGPPWTRGQESEHSRSSDDRDSPPPGPGNSGAAHWCKGHAQDPEAERQFANHGECVSWFAHQRQLDRLEDDADASTDDQGRNRFGDLEIMDVKVRDDGSFRVRGIGAESDVRVWTTGGGVVAFGQASPDANGDWTVEGRWGCQDGGTRIARLQAQDNNEVDRHTATFPCDKLGF